MVSTDIFATGYYRYEMIRKYRGLSDNAVEKCIANCFNAIPVWKKDIRTPQPQMLEAIARVLDVSYEFLVGETDVCGGLSFDDLIKSLYKPLGNSGSELYERYAVIRNYRGMLDREVSRKTGWADNVISSWRQKTVTSQPQMLEAIARVLDVSYEFLVGETDVCGELSFDDMFEVEILTKSPKKLYKRYEVIRNYRELMDSDVNEKLEKNSSVISRWKKGHVKPNSQTLREIAGVLDVSYEFLIGKADVCNGLSFKDMMEYEPPLVKSGSKLYERYEIIRNYRGLKNSAVEKTMKGKYRSVISNWKTGRTKPLPETLMAVAEALDVSYEFLIGETDICGELYFEDGSVFKV